MGESPWLEERSRQVSTIGKRYWIPQPPKCSLHLSAQLSSLLCVGGDVYVEGLDKSSANLDCSSVWRLDTPSLSLLTFFLNYGFYLGGSDKGIYWFIRLSRVLAVIRRIFDHCGIQDLYIEVNKTFKLLDRSELAVLPNTYYSISFLLPQFSFLKRKSQVNDNFAATWYIYSLQLMNVLSVFYWNLKEDVKSILDP